MKLCYEGKMYRKYTLENFCKWIERLRFVWGRDAVITITGLQKDIDDMGGFDYRIDYEVSDVIPLDDLPNLIKNREKLMFEGESNAN